MAAALLQSPIAFSAKPLPPTAPAVPARSVSLASAFSGVKLAAKARRGSAARARRVGAAGARMSLTAAGSYAAALADVAQGNGTLEATAADVEKVNNAFADAQVYGFFVNPTIDLDKKRAVLDDIASSNNLQPHTANFLNLLVDRGRVDIVREIAEEFEVAYNRMTNTELAVVSSVVKLDSQHLAQIAQAVQRLTGAKNVRIKTVIDQSLVAGFTIRYGNSGSKLIDMSVKKQLDDIASQLDFSDLVGSLA